VHIIDTERKQAKMSLDNFLGIRPPPPTKLKQLKNRGIHKGNMTKKKGHTVIDQLHIPVVMEINL